MLKIFAYLLITFLVGLTASRYAKIYQDKTDSYFDTEIVSVMAGVFWPISIPLWITWTPISNGIDRITVMLWNFNHKDKKITEVAA